MIVNAQLAAPSWRIWLIWSVGVGAYVISVMNRTSLAAVGVDTAEHFSLDASTLSLFAVIQLGVYGLMQIPVGIMLDRWGSRPVMTVGLLVIALGQLIMAFAPQIGIALAARMLLGAGDAALFPGVIRVIATWFPSQRSSLMIQLTGLMGQSGQLLALLPMAALLHLTNWAFTFTSVAAVTALFGIFTWTIVRNRPPQRREDLQDLAINSDTGAIKVVQSAGDFRISLREAWAHPGTRLAFWSHFTPPFAGTAFIMLWGVPFLTAGEGLTAAAASGVTMVFVIVGMAAGPILGMLSSRHPLQRSKMMVLPIIAAQALVWCTVIAWPGPAPMWLLVTLAIVLGAGGPASLISFDHARAHNPEHRLSTVNGLVNGAGFIAALIAIFFIGAALDLLGAGTPENYSLDAFRIAFLTQVPLWVLGATFIIVERHRTRKVLGLR